MRNAENPKPVTRNPQPREAGVSEQGRNSLAPLLRSVLFFLLCLIVGLRPLVPNSSTAFSLHLILNLLIVSAAAVYLLLHLQEKRIRIIRTGMELPIVAFLAMIVISIHVAAYKRPALLTGYSWICYLVLFLLIVNSVCGAERRVLIWVLVASVLAVSLHGFHQRVWEMPALRKRLETEPDEVLREIGIPWATVDEVWGRLEGSRVFSSFTLSNSLAGFLAMVFPVELALLVGVIRCRKRRFIRLGFYAVVLVCTVVCVYFTRSKGGWLAFLAGGGIFAVWTFSEFLRRHKMAVAVVLIGFLALIAIAHLLHLTPPRRDYRDSFKVRYGYWRAGVKLIKLRPLLGSGLGSWPDQYSIHKLGKDQEARKAHNDYVQLCVEMGFFGLAAYLWFWLTFFRRTSGSRGHSNTARGPPADEVRRLGWIATLAGIAIFLAVVHFDTPLSNLGALSTWLWPPVLWLAWTVVLWLMVMGGRDVERGRRVLAVGISAGLLAFLLHELIDFDLYVEGIAQTAFTLAALLVAGQIEQRERKRYFVNARCGILKAGVLMAICVLVVLLLSFLVTLPFARAEHEWRRARSQKETLDAFQRVALLESSLRGDPLNAEAELALSQLYTRLSLDGTSRLNLRAPTTFELAMRHAVKAAQLDPTGWSYQRQLARLFEIQWLRRGRSDLLDECVKRYRKAYRLFPSEPALSANLARQYERQGNQTAALNMYKRALELDKLQYHHTRRRLKDEHRWRVRERIRVLEQNLKNDEGNAE